MQPVVIIPGYYSEIFGAPMQYKNPKIPGRSQRFMNIKCSIIQPLLDSTVS